MNGHILELVEMAVAQLLVFKESVESPFPPVWKGRGRSDAGGLAEGTISVK